MTSVAPPQRSVFPTAWTEGSREPPWKLPWYILWRVVGAIVIVFLVLTAVFIAVEVLPGNPTSVLLPRGCGLGGISGPNCALRTQIINQWGLDKPLADRYGIFMTNILTGNLGISTTLRPGVPVWDLIAPGFWNSLLLIGLALVLVALLSILLGSFLRRRRGSLVDAVATVLLALPFAATAPMLALLVVYVFGLLLGWIPIASTPGTMGPSFYVFPLLILIAATLGLFTWMVRDDPMEPPGPKVPAGEWRPPIVSGSAQVRTGVTRFLSALPALVAWTVGAELLFEIMWSYNGAGLLLWTSVLILDTFVTMGVLLVFGLLLILPILLVADILHEWLSAGWHREDGRSSDTFRVRPADLRRGPRALLDSGTGFAGVVLVLLIVGMALAAPLLVGPYPTAFSASQPDLPPASGHLLGTDERGRDILTILLYGATPAVYVALASFALALIAGLAVLLVAGLLGPRADVFVSIPLDAALVLSIPFASYLGYLTLGAASVWLPAIFAWPAATKILQIEARGLVVTSGDSPMPRPPVGRRTIHLIWGAGPLLLGNGLLAVAFAEALSGGLGFVGVGVGSAAQFESWGFMINSAFNNLAMLRGQFWYFEPPMLAILGAVLAPLLLALSIKRELWTRRRSPAPPLPTAAAAEPETVPPPG